MRRQGINNRGSKRPSASCKGNCKCLDRRRECVTVWSGRLEVWYYFNPRATYSGWSCETLALCIRFIAPGYKVLNDQRQNVIHRPGERWTNTRSGQTRLNGDFGQCNSFSPGCPSARSLWFREYQAILISTTLAAAFKTLGTGWRSSVALKPARQSKAVCDGD